MDSIDGLPRLKRYTVIFVLVDRLSKYDHFIPLRHPYTAVTVAAAFLREVIRLLGLPKLIITDRDKVFLSNFWRELFKHQGTNLKRSTAYHPQTDGQTEVFNRSLEAYLRCFTLDSPKQWENWLSWVEYWEIVEQEVALVLPEGLIEDMEVLLQPEEVLGVHNSAGNHEVLIRWKILPGYEVTWELFDHVQQQFPDFHLEDKGKCKWIATWQSISIPCASLARIKANLFFGLCYFMIRDYVCRPMRLHAFASWVFGAGAHGVFERGEGVDLVRMGVGDTLRTMGE
nr:putative mitochondrial protein [Tanacetum cinerariifolium]